MPNYVANVVTFDGNEKRIKDMLLAVQNDEFGTGSISFNKIIPMPPELDMESSDRSKAGLRVYQDFVALIPWAVTYPRRIFFISQERSRTLTFVGTPA